MLTRTSLLSSSHNTRTIVRYFYTGGSDGVVRIWTAKLGSEQEPASVLEATQAITSIAAGVSTYTIRRELPVNASQRRTASGSREAKMHKFGDTVEILQHLQVLSRK